MTAAPAQTFALLALFALASPCRADPVTAGSVFQDGWDCRADAGPIAPYLSCLAAKGASKAVLETSRRLALPKFPVPGGFDEAGVVTEFAERGQVDVATVFFPGRANTNESMLFVNGVWPFAHPYDLLVEMTPDDPGSRALLRRYPQANPSGRVMVGAHRLLPDGTQRFAVTDILTDGCRACPPVGTLIAQVEFTKGEFSGGITFGYSPVDVASPSPERLDRLLAGDVVALQTHLNLAGFPVGSMDGVLGRNTREALAEFLADQCLDASQGASAEAMQRLVLVADGQSASHARPCAAPVAPAPSPPGLRNGNWVAEPLLCDMIADTARFAALPPDERQRIADRYMTIEGFLRLDGGRLTLGHGSCDIRAATPAAGGLRLELTCTSENTDFPMALVVQPVSDWLMRVEDRYFQRCAE